MAETSGLNWKLELLTALAMLVLVVLLRTYELGADPPTGLSISSGVETDPPQYTLYARNYVQQGDFDPFDDARRTVFLKSSMTALALGVFSVLGTGMWQGQLAGFLYAFGSLVLFWLFVRRAVNPLAGLLFLFLAAFDYNLLFFGRLSFLEHALTFWAFLGLVLLVYGKGGWTYAASGLALGVGVFFGKALGLIYLFPFACWFVYRVVFAGERRREWVLRSGLFAVGFMVVLAGWYFILYAPAQSQVTGYYGEQAVDLYGAPLGLQSIDGFFRQLVTFGDSTKLFPRMRSAGILGVVLVLMILARVTSGRAWREGFGRIRAGHVLLVALMVAFYGGLMIWNYRPLRYQLNLIYPFYAAAAAVLVMLWRPGGEGAREKLSWLFYPLAIPIVMAPVYQIFDSVAGYFGRSFTWGDDKYLVAVVAAGIVGLIGAGSSFWPRRVTGQARLGMRLVVVAVLLGNAAVGTAAYHFWMQRPTFTARDAGRDLGMVLGPGGVISGPYAPLLAAENEVEVVVHMFGVAEVDTALFARFPVTHLLLDEGNEKQMRADYPWIDPEHIVTYHIGVDKVRLFRIAGQTGNAQASAYRPSLLEEAVAAYREGETGRGHVAMAEYLTRHPENFTGYLAVGEIAAQEGQFELAERSLLGARAFSPTSYNINARVAELYKEQFEQTGEPRLRQEGLRYYEEAIRLAPTIRKLQTAHQRLKTGQVSTDEEEEGEGGGSGPEAGN